MDMKVNPPKGQLAARFGYDLPLEPLCSGGGYYLGTFSEEVGPVSRESVERFRTREEAAKALDSGDWTQREHP
jgi:hypothetical protein